MKILAVMGCSKFGNTTELVKFFAAKLNDHISAEIEYLYLYDFNLEYCVGCHNCILIGEKKCPHYAKVRQIEDRMQKADAVILASPGYMFSVTGVMKVFLDHVAYNCHRPKYFGKKMILLGNFTKWQEKGVFIPMETWASGAGFELSGKFYTDMLPFPLKEAEMEKKKSTISKASQKMSKSLISARPLRLKFGDVAMFHVLRTLCKTVPDILEADYEYFDGIKAFDKSTRWYIPVKVPVLYSLIGRLMEKMVKRQVEGVMDREKLASIKGRYVIRFGK